jgi:hypothetical protein
MITVSLAKKRVADPLFLKKGFTKGEKYCKITSINNCAAAHAERNP